jgi:hypothetical protein
MNCTYYNVPCINSFVKGTSLATGLAQYGPCNSTFWLLSINDTEFNNAATAACYLTSLQLLSKTNLILFILVHQTAPTRSQYADNRAIFNQIKLPYCPTMSSSDPPTPTIVPHGLKVITLPDRPVAPAHIGQ